MKSAATLCPVILKHIQTKSKTRHLLVVYVGQHTSNDFQQENTEQQDQILHEQKQKYKNFN